MDQLRLFEEVNDFRDHKKYREGVFKTKAQIEEELYAKGVDTIFYVLSFGAGTQSTHLLEQHLRGEIHYDYIVFSDTGAEPQFIHEQVEWWRERQRQSGNRTPFLTARHNSMDRGLEEMLMRYIHTDYQRFQLPVYCNTLDPETGEEVQGGLMPRQCTVDFKIVPVKQMVRQLTLRRLGLTSKQKMPDNIAFIIDLGFSYDEMRRINRYQSPQFKYMYLAYPLVEENLTTQDSIDFLQENHFPDKRSRCYLCPFNCDTTGVDWQEIIDSEPLSFLKACYFDEKLREVQQTGNKFMRSIPYFHYSRVPLSEAYPQDYVRFSEQYREELQAWVLEWEAYIEEKYVGVPV